MSARPILLVRARVDPARLEEFARWHRTVHLPHVLAIPGIVRARRLRFADPLPGLHLMAYEFAEESVIQAALASDEATAARNDWEPWAPHLQELSIEILAPLAPSPLLRQWS